MSNLFSVTNLPKVIPGTQGYALPKPGATVVACLMPETRDLPRPASWGQGEALKGIAGRHYHCVLDDAYGDHYPNDEFTTFYTVPRRFQPGEDPRADFLFDFWKGFDVEVVEAEKTKPAIVLGVTVEAGKFQTAEGEQSFEPGDLILQSPDNAERGWTVKGPTFIKKYQGIVQGRP